MWVRFLQGGPIGAIMKKRIVLYATISGKSARQLAEGFNIRTHGECSARVVNPFKAEPRVGADEIIFSYGCSSTNKSAHQNKRLNKSKSVLNCINKVETFTILKAAKVPTVDFVRNFKEVPKKWDDVVVRSKQDDFRGKGMEIVTNADVKKFPDAELFTEYFPHKYEYRITVFMGEVIGRYYKCVTGEGEWELKLQPSHGFGTIDAECIKAAKALDIDYVGFDVVANTKKDFRILEANSGPAITEEAEDAILNYFINLKD